MMCNEKWYDARMAEEYEEYLRELWYREECEREEYETYLREQKEREEQMMCKECSCETKCSDGNLKLKIDELRNLALPVIKYINDNYDPHTKIIVEYDRVELVRGETFIPIKEFIKD